jgi:hypothetical protein
METWRLAVGYGENYHVSDQGRVRTGQTQDAIKRGRAGQMKQQHLNPDNGYQYVTLCRDGRKRRVAVHILVARTFLGECPAGLETCHDNGVKTDNRAENLRYDTRSNNHRDKWQHGTMMHGDAHANSKLTEVAVRQIRAERPGATYAELASRYGVSLAAVRDAHIGKTWKWVA